MQLVLRVFHRVVCRIGLSLRMIDELLLVHLELEQMLHEVLEIDLSTEVDLVVQYIQR